MKNSLLNALCLVLVVLAFNPLSVAQKSKMPAPAPVPPQIAAAQKIFISNAGGESFDTVFDQVVFNGGPDRPYDQFYAAIKNSGHRDLVSTPADADLIFEISWALTDTGLKLPVLGQLRLTIVDPKTRATLWTITEYVRGAMLLSNRDKNFDQAMNTIVRRAEALMYPSPAGMDPVQK